MRAASDDPTKRRELSASGLRLLLFWDGGSQAHEIRPDARLVLGRGDDCDVRIPHESVSRHHAVLVGEGGAFRIEDQGSSNGTFVRGLRLSERSPERVDPGSVIMLGDARVVLDAGAAMLAPEREAPEAPALDEAMERVMRLVDLVADSPLPVLLLGETGVGKGHLAQQIHRRSSRQKAPFVRVNCAAVPEPLIESELFGHEKGSFTGATQTKPGLLESANGGTVFLDEIGELPRSTQAKLLHALEHNEVQRVGALHPRPLDVRFVSATNHDVEAMLAAGSLRRDLYFRIAGVPVLIPPLRDRPREIPGMARAFLAAECARARRLAPPLAPDALERLARHAWPGNLRELRNVVARAALLAADGPVRAEHLLLDAGDPSSAVVSGGADPPPVSVTRKATLVPPPDPAPPKAGGFASLDAELRDFERQCVEETLERFGGHQGKAAQHMGISRRTLTNKLNKLGLPRPRKKA